MGFCGFAEGGDDWVKATDIFRDEANADAKVKEIKAWLNSKGVRDFEPVTLFCDQLGKVRVKSK